MKAINSEQWNVICGSLIIQGILLLIFSFFDDSMSISMVFLIPIATLFIYLPIWLILKIDFLSKILLSKFIVWTFVIGWLVLMIAGYVSEKGFIEVTLIGLWILFLIGTPFGLANEELIKSRPLPSPVPTPVPTSEDHLVTCVNCGVKHTNPIKSICHSCGKDMYTKDTGKQCKDCGMNFESSLTICPHCVKSDNFYVDCVNCGTTHTNPDDSLCSNCGKNMNVKDIYKKCNSCGGDFENTEKSCPYCGN